MPRLDIVGGIHCMRSSAVLLVLFSQRVLKTRKGWGEDIVAGCRVAVSSVDCIECLPYTVAIVSPSSSQSDMWIFERTREDLYILVRLQSNGVMISFLYPSHCCARSEQQETPGTESMIVSVGRIFD